MSEPVELKFRANLPTDAQMPVRPSTDFNPVTKERRTRIWLDAYLAPGQGETLLLLGQDAELDIVITRRPKPPTYGPVSRIGEPE